MGIGTTGVLAETEGSAAVPESSPGSIDSVLVCSGSISTSDNVGESSSLFSSARSLSLDLDLILSTWCQMTRPSGCGMTVVL